MAQLEQIVRRRATDEVYDILRQSIVTHKFAPGERLKIEELSQQLGVSLTPVRHAIQQLCAEGLVEIRPRSGTFVNRLSRDEVRETFDIRRALECLAAESAVVRVSNAQLDRMRQLLHEMDGPVEGDGDRHRHEGQNSEFHRILIDASGNRSLGEMYESLKAHLQIARVHAGELGEWTSRMTDERAEHEAIVTALEARDATRLIAALRKHIDRARDALISSLSEPT